MSFGDRMKGTTHDLLYSDILAFVHRREFLRSAAAFAAVESSVRGAATGAYVRVSRRDPRYFELSDGSPYIPVGLNMIAPPRASGETESLAGLQSWLDKLSANGGNYIRVWLSNPFWDVEHSRSGVYDPERAQRIDRMLAMCRERGIRVKMTLEHFRSIGEPPVRQSWADKPAHLKANGGPAASIAEFFDGEASRAQFRRKIAWYAERYYDNPAIYGWELWNEVNAVRGGDYLAWTEAMLPHLHRAFPKNLAMQSLGSFDTDRVRGAYRRHSLMPGNDVAQVHRYLDLGASLEVCHGAVDVLAADAVRELIGYGPRRPVVLAESGAVEPKHTGPFKLYKADAEGMILHDVLFAPFFAGAAGPGQIWHWDAYVAANDLWRHFGRFAQTVRGLDPAAEAFEPALVERGSVRAYALRGRRMSLVWLRDAQSTWQTELAEGKPARTVENYVLDAAGVASVRPRRVRLYDPWKDAWTSGSAESGRIAVPAFRRSLVVRLE